MTDRWPNVRLSELLTLSPAPHAVEACAEYRNVGMYSYARGLFLKRPIAGSATSAKVLFRVKKDQFIYSRLFAFEGAYGVVPAEFDGAFVSNEYPTFDVDRSRLLPQFLELYFKQSHVWETVAKASTGVGHRRQRVPPSGVLSTTIPLPSLTDQQSVVARVEAIAGQVEEAKRLSGEAVEAAAALIHRAVTKMIDAPNWDCRLLGDVLSEPPRNGLAPQSEVQSGGRPMLRINAVSSAPTRYVDTAAAKQVSVADAVAAPFVLQHDDVFIVRYNGDINRVAKAAIYKGDNSEGTVFPDKLMRLRPDRNLMTPDFLTVALGARGVRAQIEEIGKTTAGNIGISGTNAKAFVVAVPPLPEQLRIVRDIEILQHDVTSLTHLQTAAAVAMGALLPALLDKAFRGEM